MHFYCIARGVKDPLERWINDLLAQYYPYKYHKDKPPGVVQLAVREVKLLEVVYPEEVHDEVMKIMQPRHGWDKRLVKSALFLRKVLRLDKVDMKDLENAGLPTSTYISVIPLGIKKDKMKVFAIEQL